MFTGIIIGFFLSAIIISVLQHILRSYNRKQYVLDAETNMAFLESIRNDYETEEIDPDCPDSQEWRIIAIDFAIKTILNHHYIDDYSDGEKTDTSDDKE